MRMSKRVLIVLLFFLVGACSMLSDNDRNQPGKDIEQTLPHVEDVPLATESSLVGEWQWIGSVGGIDGGITTPDSPGYTTRALRFGAEKAFSFYRADMLEVEGSYTIERKGEAAILHYETGSDQFIPRQEVRMSAGQDTMILQDLCIDCYRSLYRQVE